MHKYDLLTKTKSMIRILLNTTIIYFFLIFAMRLMGKRQLGELQLSELITTILLSEIASAPITNRDVPVFYSVLSILLIISFEILLPILMSKFTFLKRLVESKPSYIIYKGELSQKELKKNRITIEELLASLRTSNISDISELQYLILEPNGKLSYFPKLQNKNVTVGDMKLSCKDSGIAHPLIIDSVICKNQLQLLEISDSLLDSILQRYNVSIENVFLLTIDDCGSINLIRRK